MIFNASDVICLYLRHSFLLQDTADLLGETISKGKIRHQNDAPFSIKNVASANHFLRF